MVNPQPYTLSVQGFTDTSGVAWNGSLTFTPVPTPVPKPVTGLNQSAFPAVSSAIGGVSGVRAYRTPGPIPAAYPGNSGGALPAGATLVVVSLKPDIASFIQGAQDAAFTAYVKSCPPSTMLTLWHEGERANEGHAAQDIVNLHTRAHALAVAAKPSVLYGQVYTCYSSTNGRVTDFTAPGMDFYGLDGYASSDNSTADSIFGATLKQLRMVDGADGPVAVTEVNADSTGKFSAGLSAARVKFFNDAWAWAKAHSAVCYFPFWNDGTAATWVAGDTAVIGALSAIVTDSKS